MSSCAKAAAVGTGQACRLVFDKRWIGSNNMKDGRSSGSALCGKCVEGQKHIMLRCDDRRMVARMDIHSHVRRDIHRGGPGASALETIALETNCGHCQGSRRGLLGLHQTFHPRHCEYTTSVARME
jgi:hypothetical protein